MTAKHKNPNGSPTGNKSGREEDEKIFDFDKPFSSPEDPEPATRETSEELEAALSEMKEKNLRLLAEFDNYKKRTSRERYELMTSASKEVVMALIPVVDDFERALKAKNESEGDSFIEGVRLIYTRLLNVLQSQGLKAMESTGETFDPDLHDAITDVPVKDQTQAGKVIDTIEKGYLLNEKIIRHAKVVVGK